MADGVSTAGVEQVQTRLALHCRVCWLEVQDAAGDCGLVLDACPINGFRLWDNGFAATPALQEVQIR